MTAVDPFASTYDRCMQNAPLRCDQPQKPLNSFPMQSFVWNVDFRRRCQSRQKFGAIAALIELWGFVRSQGMGRLYKGIRVSDGKPVVIKEYLLPNRGV